MRKLLFAGTAIALAALPSVASAQVYIADSYPPAAGVVVTPAGRRRADGREPGLSRARHDLCAARQRTEWEDRPIIIEGQRYYRDCWWDWGRRRCELKPWW